LVWDGGGGDGHVLIVCDELISHIICGEV
jgi:hypothetical protein